METRRVLCAVVLLSLAAACESREPVDESLGPPSSGLNARIKEQTYTATGTQTATSTSTATGTTSTTGTATGTTTTTGTGTLATVQTDNHYYQVSASVTATNTAYVYYYSWTRTGAATATANRTATATTSSFGIGTRSTIATNTVTSPYNATETKTITGSVTASGLLTGTPTAVVTATATSTNPTTGTSTHTYAGTGTRTLTATGSNTGNSTQSWTYHPTATITNTATSTVTATVTGTSTTTSSNTTTQTVTLTETNTQSDTQTETSTATGTDTTTSTSTTTSTTTTTSTSTCTDLRACSPSPADGANDVSVTPTLSWMADSTAVFDVYFGTPAPTLVSSHQSATTYTPPGPLANDMNYYWRVDTIYGSATYSGKVWNFVTASPTTSPGQASSPSPADHATGVPVTAELSWTAGSGATKHFVRYGKSIGTDTTGWDHTINNLSDAHYTPRDLEAYTPYYWRIDEKSAAGTTLGTVWTFTTGALVPPGAANSPGPATGNSNVELRPQLAWSPGIPAGTSRDVFFGTSDTALTLVSADQRNTYYQSPLLTNGNRYYWRVDEKNAAGTTPGPVWSFTTTSTPFPGQASSPSPHDGAVDVDVSPTLTWTAGSNATRHNIFWGTSESNLTYQTFETNASYAPAASLPSGKLDPGIYFWRIDENNAAGTTPGPVWKFTTQLPAVQPARAKITRCTPDPQEDATGGGYGHAPDGRRVNVQFAYASPNTWDDPRKSDVAAATTRVELCIVDSTGGPPTCNAGSNSDWLIYDSSSKPAGIAPTADNMLGAGDNGLPPGIDPLSFRVPGIDYASTANKGKFVILRINGEPTDDARRLGGTCPLPYLITNTAHFEAYGTEDSVADPWAGSFGAPCASTVIYTKTPQCIALTSAQEVLSELEGLAGETDLGTGWQFSRFGAPTDKKPWQNGTNASPCAANGGVCKGHIRIYPLGQQGASGFYDHPGMLALSTEDLAALTDPLASRPLQVIAHEMFHGLQFEYSTTMHRGFVEGSTAAIENNACITNLPSLSPRCISAGQLGEVNGEIQPPFNHPANDNLATVYESGIYWRYFMEQYALPLKTGGFARPTGGQAAEHESDPEIALGDRRRSADEGTDLMRRILEAASSAGDQPPLLQLTDAIVTDRLQRNLDNLLLDFHTAMLLKDYGGAPYEWRFEWVGDYTAGAVDPLWSGGPQPKDPIEKRKPFALPASARADDLPRAYRVVDRASLGPNETVANGTEEVINAYGAAFLSVVPAMPADSIVRVQLRPAHHGAPRFRVFTVDSSRFSNVTIVPQCAQVVGSGPGAVRRCIAGTDGNVSVDIATGSGASAVAEILVVASASAAPASFFYQIGASNPIVDIQSPTAGQPALAGTPNPNGTARPFLVEFVVRDADGKSINGLSADQLRLSAVNGTTTTTLDVRLMPLSGGTYLARATIPVASLPTADNTKLDLKVEYLDQTGSTVLASQTKSGVLLVQGTPPTVATQLLLDVSDSMNEDNHKKLNAMKQAASFLLDTIPDGDQVGVLLYANDAHSWSPIAPLDDARRTTLKTNLQGVTAGGCTSLGDALMEAQSILNTTFSGGNSPILSMLMLTDGINTNNWMPSYYYAPNAPSLPDQPNANGKGGKCGLKDPNPPDGIQWVSGSLKWKDQSLKPRVSTIAFGQDADLTELTNIANATGGVFVYADEGGVGQVGNATHALADAYRQGYNRAAQTPRIGAARVATKADLPPFVVEQSAQNLQVSLLWTSGSPSGALDLKSPDGTLYAPSIHDQTAVYRVSAPASGQWTWYEESGPPPLILMQMAGTSTDGPAIFVEEVITSPLVLLAVADVEGAGEAGFDSDSGSWVGRNVFIRAIPTDGGDLLGASVTGTVLDPNGTTTNITLYDDGQHSDGAAGDGIYGTVLQNPSIAGAYSVKLAASGTSAKVGPFERQTSVGFSLHAAPDTDSDGVPDWCDPQPLVPDADDDPDHDGLTNAEECALGTDPTKDDTDDGGEDDGSEVAAGNDPTNRGDDRVKPYMIHVSPCHGKVLITPEVPISGNVEVEMSSSGLFGPYSLVYSGGASGPFQIDAPTGNEQCYRMRTVGAAVSAWSPPYCIATSTASVDPNPPSVKLSVAGGKTWVRSRRVTLNVMATDAQDPSSHLPRCTDATVSGVTDMQVSFTPDFNGVAWRPYSRQVTLDLPATGNTVAIWVRVRDGAGNISEPAFITVQIENRLAADFLLYGTSGVRLEDGVTLVGSSGGPGALASEAPTVVTEIGARASTGDVVSMGPVFLRANGKIDGSVETAQDFTQQDGATVVGSIAEDATVVLPGLPSFAIQPGTGSAVYLAPDETRPPLSPGNYGNLTLNPRSKLTLQSGTYRFGAIQIEPDAQVILNKSTGPVRIHASSLVHRGKIIDQGGYYGQTLVAVSGTNPIYIEGTFIGTLLAPNADVTIGTAVALKHWGVFQARSILVRSTATLYDLPWDYTE